MSKERLENDDAATGDRTRTFRNNDQLDCSRGDRNPINAKLLNDPEKLNAVLANIPLKRMEKPEDVAGVAAFLASSDADYITGATVFVDGGLLWNYEEQ